MELNNGSLLVALFSILSLLILLGPINALPTGRDTHHMSTIRSDDAVVNHIIEATFNNEKYIMIKNLTLPFWMAESYCQIGFPQKMHLASVTSEKEWAMLVRNFGFVEETTPSDQSNIWLGGHLHQVKPNSKIRPRWLDNRGYTYNRIPKGQLDQVSVWQTGFNGCMSGSLTHKDGADDDNNAYGNWSAISVPCSQALGFICRTAQRWPQWSPAYHRIALRVTGNALSPLNSLYSANLNEHLLRRQHPEQNQGKFAAFFNRPSMVRRPGPGHVTPLEVQALLNRILGLYPMAWTQLRVHMLNNGFMIPRPLAISRQRTDHQAAVNYKPFASLQQLVSPSPMGATDATTTTTTTTPSAPLVTNSLPTTSPSHAEMTDLSTIQAELVTPTTESLLTEKLAKFTTVGPEPALHVDIKTAATTTTTSPIPSSINLKSETGTMATQSHPVASTSAPQVATEATDLPKLMSVARKTPAEVGLPEMASTFLPSLSRNVVTTFSPLKGDGEIVHRRVARSAETVAPAAMTTPNTVAMSAHDVVPVGTTVGNLPTTNTPDLGEVSSMVFTDSPAKELLDDLEAVNKVYSGHDDAGDVEHDGQSNDTPHWPQGMEPWPHRVEHWPYRVEHWPRRVEHWPQRVGRWPQMIREPIW